MLFCSIQDKLSVRQSWIPVDMEAVAADLPKCMSFVKEKFAMSATCCILVLFLERKISKVRENDALNVPLIIATFVFS